MLKTLYTIAFIIFFSALLKAQELNCNIQVTAPQVAGTDRAVFETLQRDLYEFVNNRQWTNYNFTMDERIEVNMLITIQERISADEFKGTMQVQARRPVFRSSYNTTLLNHVDNDIHFRYIEHQPLEFSDNTHTSNLTSLIAFYVYLVLGLDFDSFSLNGGTPFFEKAEAVVINAQNAPEQGWKAFESQRNRYWIIENLLNQQYAPIREAIYKYHRQGLDRMHDNIETGRASVVESIELLQRVHRQRPNSFLMQVFFNAKSDEFVNIFSEAPPMDKPRVVNMLREIDPTNTSRYQQILSQQ